MEAGRELDSLDSDPTKVSLNPSKYHPNSKLQAYEN